ncbi:hypothetical protein niasHT_004109 [Heterodera trifolii]|uniref:Uncharacterized protein n=1 Tax=Heterodera trifolii TaxID=157864 RepID=A0ABD2LTM6_9BILA
MLDLEQVEVLQNKEEFQNFIGRGGSLSGREATGLSSPNVGENMATVQGLLKKHDTFEVGLQMHQQRIDELQRQGKKEILFLPYPPNRPLIFAHLLAVGLRPANSVPTMEAITFFFVDQT